MKIPLWNNLWKTIIAHRWKLFALFIAVLLPLYLFATLAEDVLEQERFFFDDPILLFVHRFETPARDRVMLWITSLGYMQGIVPASVALFLFLLLRGWWYDGLFFVLALGGTALLNIGTKLLFLRERPKLWASIAPETTFSFPSAHAMGSMALLAALVVFLWHTRWRYLVLIPGSLFVFLVGLSRIYLGVHYPSDILAGWLAALAWVLGLSMLLYGRITHPGGRSTDGMKQNVPAHP